MNGSNPTYAESVIRKAKEGKLTTGQAARIPPKTVIGICVVRSGKQVAVFDGGL